MSRFDDYIHLTEKELLVRADRASKLGIEYADFIGTKDENKDLKEYTLGAMKAELRPSQDKKISDKELTSRVVGTPEWKNFITELAESNKKAYRKKMEYEGAVREYEAYRSAISARKKELELG